MMRLALAVVHYFNIGYAALILDFFHPFVDIYSFPIFIHDISPPLFLKYSGAVRM